MNVIELYKLTNWIQDEIVQAEIPREYQNLYVVLQQNTQPNQQKIPFDNEKEKLILALNSVQHSVLTKDQISFLSNLGIMQQIGKVGANAIEDILFRNGLDIASAATKVQERLQTLNEGIRKANLISEGIQDCIEISDEDNIDGVLIRISFLGGASISNVVDFKKWGILWHDIGRGIAQAHDCSPEDIRVVGAAKGSVIIELITLATISGTVSRIILDAFKVAEKVLDLKKKATEVQILNIQEKKLVREIENAAEKEKTAGIENIITEQVKQLNLKNAKNGDKITALEKSVRELVNFIEAGGEVDFVTPEEKKDEEGEVIPDDYSLVRKHAEDIRKLEDHLRQIENNSELDE